jgi:prevent-host-death family protein
MEGASRELRNSTRSLLERVEGGEEVTIAVNGKAIAVLRPAGRRTSWMARDEFAWTILAQQADPGLTQDLVGLAPESTGDLSHP